MVEMQSPDPTTPADRKRSAKINILVGVSGLGVLAVVGTICDAIGWRGGLIDSGIAIFLLVAVGQVFMGLWEFQKLWAEQWDEKHPWKNRDDN